MMAYNMSQMYEVQRSVSCHSCGPVRRSSSHTAREPEHHPQEGPKYL